MDELNNAIDTILKLADAHSKAGNELTVKTLMATVRVLQMERDQLEDEAAAE
jgi:hypothetical protein